jgi:uncharacterized protein (TIGR00303 family)
MTMQTKRSLIDIVNSHPNQGARAKKILTEISRAQTVDFNLALGATAISDLVGASAAGADPQARRLTPKLDAEALVMGRTARGEPLPSSPIGVTSPVVITRACLSLIVHQVNIIDCGTFVPPQVEHVETQGKAGKNIALANSMDLSCATMLFNQGREMALSRVLQGSSLPVLAECVPGGTTTALGVLTALGVMTAMGPECDQMLSSSIPGQKVGLQAKLVAAGMDRLNQDLGQGELKRLCLEDPLHAVSYLGDPMQAFAAGFILGALEGQATKNNVPEAVVLAGGSQMLAVYALVKALAKTQACTACYKGPGTLSKLVEDRLIVMTTKWVAYDIFANTKQLALLVDAPYVAACPDFRSSRHAGLQAYEDGHVKEGVGAGAALILAGLLGRQGDGGKATSARGVKEDTIIDTIDKFYDSMVLP